MFDVVVADKAFRVIIAAVNCAFGVTNVESCLKVTVADVECAFGVNVADMESKFGVLADCAFEMVVLVADVKG